MSVNIFENGKLKKIAGNVRDDDTSDSTVTFESGDNLTPVQPTSVPLITSGETHKSLFQKLSTMAKNTRYLLNMLGTTDISSIADGTVTGAVKWLTGIAATSNTYAYLVASTQNSVKFEIHSNICILYADHRGGSAFAAFLVIGGVPRRIASEGTAFSITTEWPQIAGVSCVITLTSSAPYYIAGVAVLDAGSAVIV